MNTAFLIRDLSDDQGTPGVLFAPGFYAHTLELPWYSNQRKVSCIPDGKYLCRIKQSPRFGRVYQVMDVPGRSDILIHAGNYAGDKSLGRLSDVEGCILVGERRGVMRGQRAVLVSRPAVRGFMNAMQGQDFRLEVVWKSSL